MIHIRDQQVEAAGLNLASEECILHIFSSPLLVHGLPGYRKGFWKVSVQSIRKCWNYTTPIPPPITFSSCSSISQMVMRKQVSCINKHLDVFCLMETLLPGWVVWKISPFFLKSHNFYIFFHTTSMSQKGVCLEVLVIN